MVGQDDGYGGGAGGAEEAEGAEAGEGGQQDSVNGASTFMIQGTYFMIRRENAPCDVGIDWVPFDVACIYGDSIYCGILVGASALLSSAGRDHYRTTPHCHLIHTGH